MLTLVVTKQDGLDRTSDIPDISDPNDDFSNIRFLQVSEVDTPAKHLFFLVQRMLIENDIARYQAAYFDLIAAFLSAIPTTRPFLENASIHIACGDYRAALNYINQLVVFEASGFGLNESSHQTIHLQVPSQITVSQSTFHC